MAGEVEILKLVRAQENKERSGLCHCRGGISAATLRVPLLHNGPQTLAEIGPPRSFASIEDLS